MNETHGGALVKAAPRSFSLMPQSLGEAKEIAGIIANSGMAPKDYVNKPEAIIIAIQMGADVGLKPMQALQNIAVINGRPSIWGDAATALCMPALERFHETFEGEWPKDDFMAVCVVRRKGFPDEIRREFSIADAKKANLWGKSGPWQTYPKRMLQMRARGFALRDAASDMLMGLVLAEEAGDIQPAIEGTVVSSETVEQPKSAGVFDQLPEGIRDNIEKAFETLSFSPAQRLAKLNEFFGADNVNPEEAAMALLDWLKDEYAKRRTGQPRRKGSNNGKGGKAESAGAGSGAEAGQSPAGASTSTPAGDPPASQPAAQSEPPKAETKPEPADALF